MSIYTNPQEAYNEVETTIKGRFPMGEDAMSKDAMVSLAYALNYLKDRFLKGEEAIAKHPMIAYMYARKLLRGRFEAGEESILAHPLYRKLYINFLNSCA